MEKGTRPNYPNTRQHPLELHPIQTPLSTSVENTLRCSRRVSACPICPRQAFRRISKHSAFNLLEKKDIYNLSPLKFIVQFLASGFGEGAELVVYSTLGLRVAAMPVGSGRSFEINLNKLRPGACYKMLPGALLGNGS